jgi:hypothetical protein
MRTGAAPGHLLIEKIADLDREVIPELRMSANGRARRNILVFGHGNSGAQQRLSNAAARRILGPGRPRTSAFGLALALLLGPAACTGAPATVALQPDFEMMTGAGVASVSIRQPLPGTTFARSTELIRTGMARAAPGSVLPGPIDPPFPSRRIVWHVDQIVPMGASRLIVNVFDGATPYAYEQEVVGNSASPAMVTSAIESMSKRLVVAIAARATTPPQGRAENNIASN